jgi:hypothetical protein
MDARQLLAKVAAGGAVVAAIFFGGLIGSGDFSAVKLVVFVALGLVHVLFLLDRTWALGFALCIFDLWLVGFGFRISSTEAGVALAAGFAALVCWRRTLPVPPPVCDTPIYRGLRLLLTAFLGYLAGHLIFNHLNPFLPGDYDLRNFARTVVSTGGPLIILWLLLRFPRGFPGDDTFPRLLAFWLLGGLLFNIGAGIRLLVGGTSLALGQSGEPTTFIIPFLDAAPNVYALRRISITAVLVGAGFGGTNWVRGQALPIRLMFWSLIPLGLLGSILSGGRAVPATALVVLVGVYAIRGRFMPAVLTAVFLALLTATLNTFPSAIRDLPPPIQRSVALLIFTDRVEARSSIENSSAWRWEVFQRATAEWLSDRRIFWFGRGSFPWTAADDRLMTGFSSSMDSAIRRGATHNILSDLLVMYGLTGAILYFLILAAWERFLVRCRRFLADDEIGSTLAMLCWVQLLVYTSIGLMAVPAEVAWMTGLLVGRMYRRQNSHKPSLPLPAQKPAT